MPAMSDPETTLVERAIEALLAERDPRTTAAVEFRAARFDHGLSMVHFPKGAGGLGVRPELNRLVHRRLRDAGGPPGDPAMFFLNLAGPTIAVHGTDEQKSRWLRPMMTGEERWCQLFSEPGAGSDFAGLATRAVRDGDEWVVNGQKVWNTLAHLGDRGMLVARTDPEAPKHKGLTYFGLDMHAPGVEVRPLRQITGEAEFNEVYLTDVRIPDADRIGAVGEGWRVSLTTLMNERVSLSGAESDGARRGGAAADAVDLWAAATDGDRSVVRRDRLMAMWCRGEVLRLTNERAAQMAKVGTPGPSGSITKLALAELNKDVYELCLDLLGAEGMTGFDYTFRRPEMLDMSGVSHGPRHAFLRSRANSIEGGTSEIMRNILGEQVLGLPGEPRVDKDRPWSEVPRS
jgi:alkylation response protein AidB-like acyl-CoA dehydrogenase